MNGVREDEIMVQNIWIRGKELANMLGLLCGSVAIIVTGNQISNSWVYNLGFGATFLFIIFIVLTIILIFRDAIYHPKGFWASFPLKG